MDSIALVGRRKVVQVEESFVGIEPRRFDDTVVQVEPGNRPPAYPSTAIQQRLEGILVLRLYVATTGASNESRLSRPAAMLFSIVPPSKR